MKNKTYLHKLGEQVAQDNNFKVDKIIHEGFYYKKDEEHIRNVIYGGVFQRRPAVLKVYDDPRRTTEPVSLKDFNQRNKSKIIVAPELYKFKMLSLHKGWLIEEKLPEKGELLKSPLKPEGRKKFVKLYLEYRLNFPIKSSRPLFFTEKLSADEFHLYRQKRWLELADIAEAELELNKQEPLLDHRKFLKNYLYSGNEIIQKEFRDRKMIWCHGHFRPKALYKVNDQEKYYLLDFSQAKLYPEGYELAFIIWADYLMASDYFQPYAQWKSGVFDWVDKVESTAKKLKIRNYPSLIKASMVERILGTVLADICVPDFSRGRKLQMIKYLYKLFDELTN